MNDRRNILFYFRVKDVHCVLSRQSIALSGRDHKEQSAEREESKNIYQSEVE